MAVRKPAPPEGPWVYVADIVSAAEIADRLAVARQLVHVWRERHPDFPVPIAELGGTLKPRPGDNKPTRSGVLVWNWPDIEAWAIATNRTIKPADDWAPPIRSTPKP